MLKESDLNLKGVNLYTDFPVITSKTNSGKTTYAIKELRHTVEKYTGRNPKLTIFLTPLKSTYEQVMNDARFLNVANIKEADNALYRYGDSVFVCTYAAFALLLERNSFDFSESLIVFDELDLFMRFTTYQEQMKYIVRFLVKKETFESAITIGLTGTPQIIAHAGNRVPFKFVDITPNSQEVLKAQKGVIYEHSSIETVIKSQVQKKQIKGSLVYVHSAKKAMDITSYLNDCGVNAGFIVSKSNTSYDCETGLMAFEVMESQKFDGLTLFDYISKNNDVPQELYVLVINDAASYGINLLDKDRRFHQVIVESTNSATIEQVRSRIRHNIDIVSVVFTYRHYNLLYENKVDTLVFEKKYKKTFLKRESLLFERVRKQDESHNDAIAKKARYSQAMKDGKYCYYEPSDTLMLSAYYFEDGCIYNPFAAMVAEFDYEVFRNEANGLADSINHLLDDSTFEVISSDSLLVDLHNQRVLDDLDIFALFGLDTAEQVILTKDEYDQKLKSLDIRRSGRQKVGKTKKKQWLESQGITVEPFQKRIGNGKRSTFYKVRAQYCLG